MQTPIDNSDRQGCSYFYGVIMIRYNATAFLKFDSETTGNAFSMGPVTVFFAGTETKADLFNDSLGTMAKNNPVMTDQGGQYFFYVADGNYDIIINEGRIGEARILDENIAQPATIPANQRVINSLTDLPAPVAGVITLEDNITYVFGSPITTADRIVVGVNNVITSNAPLSTPVTYTGTGSFITGIDKNLLIKEIGLICPNAQAFDFSSTTVGNIFVANTIVIFACDSVGTFDDLNTVEFINSSSIGTASQGIVVQGTTNWTIFSVAELAIITTSATLIGIDFGTSLHTTLELSNLVISGVPGTIGIKGAAASANLKVNSLATVLTGEFIGGVTPLSGITITDIRWSFKLNSGLPDSLTNALISVEGNVLETTINTMNVPEKVNGVWSDELLSHFSSDGTGRITFLGERSEVLLINATANLRMASSASDRMVTSYLAINGAVLTQTSESGVANVTDPTSLAMVWQHNFQTGDFVEIFVENNDNTVNIIAIKCLQSVK